MYYLFISGENKSSKEEKKPDLKLILNVAFHFGLVFLFVESFFRLLSFVRFYLTKSSSGRLFLFSILFQEREDKKDTNGKIMVNMV